MTTTLFGVNGNGADGPASSTSYGGDIVEGLLIQVTASGQELVGYGYWRADSEQSDSASFALWETIDYGAGTLVAGSEASISGMTTGAWNYVSLATPIALTEGQEYKAQVGVTGNFLFSPGAFGADDPYTDGITEGDLFAFSDAVGNAPDPYGSVQCSYNTGSADPTAGYVTGGNSAYNAWLDVQITLAASFLAAPMRPRGQAVNRASTY